MAVPAVLFPDLGFPEGTNIVFTDSMPLLALLTKASYQATGHWLNYFGFWLFACFPLLAALLRADAGAAHRGPGCDAGGGVPGRSFPALLVRFGHASLMGHFYRMGAVPVSADAQ